MTVGSLFSGIGGLELGLERSGMTVQWQVEKDDYCRRVLAKHWPDVPRYEDVHDVGAHNLEPVDLICGGFPCQPVSIAGKQLAQDDDRWLWPEFARIIRELRPRYALMENVPGLLVRGFGDVLGDLAALGYDAEWCVLGADDVGAPHRRKRVLIVAHAQIVPLGTGLRESGPGGFGGRRLGDSGGEVADSIGAGLERYAGDGSDGDESRRLDAQPHRPIGAGGLRTDEVADPRNDRRERNPQRDGEPEAGKLAQQRDDTDGRHDPSEGTHARTDRQGQPRDWWSVEPDVGRVAHGIPARVDRLRALGNAVVPQVAEWIGNRIMENA